MSTLLEKMGPFSGHYRGSGFWIDSQSVSKKYRVDEKIELENGSLRAGYSHEFFEEGENTSGNFVFEPQNDALFRVLLNGAACGAGYIFGDYLQFHIQIGEIFVQTSYTVTSTGLIVHGSSNKNKQGNYIAWSEELARE